MRHFYNGFSGVESTGMTRREGWCGEGGWGRRGKHEEDEEEDAEGEGGGERKKGTHSLLG